MSARKNRRLPEIIGIGPGRTGTTWLHRVLEGHVDLPDRRQGDQVFQPLLRQGHRLVRVAFSLRDRRSKNRRDLSRTCYKREAPERIKTHIPNCRMITTLRDPVDPHFPSTR